MLQQIDTMDTSQQMNAADKTQGKKLRYIFSDFNSGRPYCRQELSQLRTYGNICAIFDGSKLIYAAETSRFTKKQNDFTIPLRALRTYQKFASSSTEPQLHPLNSNACSKDLHLDHAYEAFYLSGFDEAAVLVAGSCGNSGEHITLAYMQKNKPVRILKKISLENCAMQDADATQDLVATQATKAAQAEKATQDAKTSQAAWCSSKKEEAVLQAVCTLKELLRANNITTNNLALSGNAISNALLNSKIVDLALFEHYYASPQLSDACALAIGHAYRLMQEQNEPLDDTRLTSPYLGVSYPKSELFCPYIGMKYPIADLCEYLSAGKIIMWYQDGSELGASTLGHRSFLVDPTSKEMAIALARMQGKIQNGAQGEVLDKISPMTQDECSQMEKQNPQLKDRALQPAETQDLQLEFFPIVPEELFSRIFEVNNTDLCEYKLRRLSVKKKWQARLQVACSKDGITRPQLLRRETNPELYGLLMSYFEKTKIPCLISTELAIDGFPLLETPRDLCDLLVEFEFMKNVPDAKAIYVQHGFFWELSLPQGGVSWLN